MKRISSGLMYMFIYFSAFPQGEKSRLAVDSFIPHFVTSGGLIGYGPTFSDNTNYTVYYFAGDFSWSLGKARKKDFLSIYFEPQVNLVRTDRPWDFEFGANLGLRNYIRFKEHFYFYQSLGSGPHFITARLDRQATGFIFSDNLFLGSLFPVNNRGLINLQFGVRHISNANLKLPNRGVNTMNFRIGYSVWKWSRPIWKRSRH